MRRLELIISSLMFVSWQQYFVAIANEPTQAARPAISPVNIESLPNAYRLHKKVISGGQPDGKVGFQALQELGVRSVISVYKARPEVDLAKKYGLQYVHLPQSYDGVPEVRARELAKAVSELPGPIYIHCQYGKPRGPAAAVIACIGAGLLPADRGREILSATRASKDFRGLYRSVGDAVRYEGRQLRDLRVTFSEIAEPPPIADVMLRLPRSLKNLKLIAESGWKTPKLHPTLIPRKEALSLREQFAELVRTNEVKQKPQEFRDILQHSLAMATALEKRVAALPDGDVPINTREQLTEIRATIRKDCKSCHAKFRDN